MEFCIEVQSKDAIHVAGRLRRAIGGLAGIHYTSQVINPAAGAETLLVGLAPGEVPVTLRMIKSITARLSGAPLNINIAAAGFKISFDPRRTTPAQLNALADRLMDAIPA